MAEFVIITIITYYEGELKVILSVSINNCMFGENFVGSGNP